MPPNPRDKRRDPGAAHYFRMETICEEMELTPQMVRRYERRGLIRIEWIQTPDGKERAVLRLREVKRLRRICLLTTDLRVNLAGVEVILRLLDRIEEAE